MATVLLASDLESLLRELRTMLEGPDLLIEEVATGPEVVSRVREGGVDLAIVDLQIGSMGGMAVCLELRRARKTSGRRSSSMRTATGSAAP